MSVESRFADAFSSVLRHSWDRRILTALRGAGRELRYEELRRLIDSPHPQTFQTALNRLMDVALIARRIHPDGPSNRSQYQPTKKGLDIAEILQSLADEGCFPATVHPQLVEAAKQVLIGSQTLKN